MTIKARRGTLERACSLLADVTYVPILAPLATKREIDICREFGYNIRNVLDVGSNESQTIIASERFINLTSIRDDHPDIPQRGSVIILDAYQAGPNDPFQELGPRTCRLAMSNHAGFDDIIRYVDATGAKYVLTDSVRAGHPMDLSEQLRARLGIES